MNPIFVDRIIETLNEFTIAKPIIPNNKFPQKCLTPKKRFDSIIIIIIIIITIIIIIIIIIVIIIIIKCDLMGNGLLYCLTLIR